MIRLIPKEKFEFIVNLNIQYLICKYTMNTTYNWKLYNDIISEFKNESEMFEWLKYDSLLDKPAAAIDGVLHKIIIIILI
jgi:hypothetical protein